jgi:CRISPR system Cascade subunit CasA
MVDKQFNLIDSPWILVRRNDGVIEEVSMLEAYERAAEFKELAGELPTQDVAILRLLLAPLYGVFMQKDVNGNERPLVRDYSEESEVLDRWKQLWAKSELPVDLIKGYLETYQGRFFLFHPETPFFQVADLQTKDGSYNAIAQIIADVPSRAERRFFSNRAGDSVTSLSFSEAARWLVHLHAWDYAGKKAATVGGAPNGGGTGWLGKLGVVYARRKSLFETLLLNLVFSASDGSLLGGSPIWEQPARTAKKEDRLPQEYIELLTWQSRRVRLLAEGDRVVGILSSYGDVFEKEDTTCEQMSGWHVCSAGPQKGRLIPNLHRSDRSFWRDLHSLLPQASGQKDGVSESRVPGIISWLALLRRKELIESARLDICAVGLEYGSMQGVVQELINDSITVNLQLLSDLGSDWIVEILTLVKLSEDCVSYLGTFAKELAEASGDDDDKSLKAARVSAQEEMYFTLDREFKIWLAGIDPVTSNCDDERVRWVETVRNLVLAKGDELMLGCSSQALIGSNMGNNAFRAELKFKRSVNKRTRLGTRGKEVS